jgi:hypothetical protein
MAEQRPAAMPRGLMERLLEALRKPVPEKLKPAGQRSGRGAKSLEPYLDEGRKSRPAPLD